MKKITIYDYRSNGNEVHSLIAEIKENGDLILSGYDCGQSVKEYFGDFDHEYWLKVKAENISTVLLYLIKDQFKSDTGFRKWLEEKVIQFNFTSFT
jgi:hypothetical protein